MTTCDKKETSFVDFYDIWIAVRCFLVKPSKYRRLVHTASWFCSLEQLVSAFAVNSNYDSLARLHRGLAHQNTWTHGKAT